MYIVIAGALGDGKTFIGPFDSESDAIDYADTEYRSTNWEVVSLDAPIDLFEDTSEPVEWKATDDPSYDEAERQEYERN